MRNREKIRGYFGIVIVLVTIIFSTEIVATEQFPDSIKYNGKRSFLQVKFASPLEVFYMKNRKEYPFKSDSTGNYRGHVAHWEVIKSELFLTKVVSKNSSFKLSQLNNKRTNNSKVKATWFSGILWLITIELSEEEKSRPIDENEDIGESTGIMSEHYTFLTIEKGKLIKATTLTPDEYWKKLTEIVKSRKTDSPIKSGIVYEFQQYWNSVRNDLRDEDR